VLVIGDEGVAVENRFQVRRLAAFNTALGVAGLFAPPAGR